MSTVYVNNYVGSIYKSENGVLVPLANDFCLKSRCTEAFTVDTKTKTYRTVIAVNSQFPCPILIVYQDQTVIVDVKNNLTDQDITIHWHGMFQFNTPWMDGVGLVTQCPIGIGSKFHYTFKASPTGIFWYQSHSSVQRSDGLFGGLIVMERNQRLWYCWFAWTADNNIVVLACWIFMRTFCVVVK